MDPFSVATGVISLVVLAYQAAQEVDRLVEAYKNVPDELKYLKSQVSYIQAALTDFEEFFLKRTDGSAEKADANARPRFTPNQKWLENMSTVLRSLTDTEKEVAKILEEVGPIKNKLVRHWKWQHYQGKVNMLQKDLDRNVQTLLFMMSTFTGMSDAYLRDEVHHISTQVTLATTTETPLQKVETPPPKYESVAEETAPALPKRPILTHISSFASGSSMSLLSKLPSLSMFSMSDTEPEELTESPVQDPTSPIFGMVPDMMPAVTWVAGYYFHGEERFCAVVSPTNKTTAFRYSRSPVEMREMYEDMSGRGYRMRHLNVHSAPDGGMRYCQIYVQPRRATDGVLGYPAWNLDAEAFDAKNNDLKRAGYTCTHISACGLLSGEAAFAGIWEKHQRAEDLQSNVTHSLTTKELSELRSSYYGNPSGGADSGFREETGACAYEDGSGYIKFATVFSKRPQRGFGIARTSKDLLNRSDLPNAMAARQKEGYRLTAITPFVLTNQESFNCSWQTIPQGWPDRYESYAGISREMLETHIQRLGST